jgi:hypothetical protein
MPRFRKKPVEIDAIQWLGTEESLQEALRFIDIATLPNDREFISSGIGWTPGLGTLDIPTLEGVMTAQPGDWIIRGVAGEYYPCKLNIFEATYDPVN